MKARGAAILIAGLLGSARASAATTWGAPFPVALRGALSSDTRVAASADRFLIVWTDSSGPSADVLGRIVRASDGQAIGGAFVIAGTDQDEESPAVSSDGTNFLVTWFVGSPSELRATRISPTGAVLDADGIQLGAGEFDAFAHAAIAWNGTEWLVAWVHDNQIVARRVSPAGSVLDSAPVVDSTAWRDCSFPQVAADGGKFLLGYRCDWFETKILDGSGAISSSFVDEDDESAFVAPEAIATGSTSDLVTWLSNLWDGPVSSTAIDPATGRIRSPSTVSVSGALQRGPRRQHSALVYAGRWWIVHEEPTGLDPNVVMDGEVVFPDAWQPQIAFTANTGLVTATRGEMIMARVFDVDGHPLTETDTPVPLPTPPARIVIPTGPAPSLGSEIEVSQAIDLVRGGAVESARDRFLVVWSVEGSSDTTVYGQLFRGSDEKALTAPIELGVDDGYPPPSIATDGTSFLVTWTQGGAPPGIAYVAVRPDGTVDPPATPVVGDAQSNHPSVEWDGNSWLLVWQEGSDLHPEGAELRDTRITSGLEALTPGGRSLVRGLSHPYVASGGRGSVVMGTAPDGMLEGVTITDPLALVGLANLGPQAYSQGYLFDEGGVAGNGRDYLVTYDCEWRCMEGDEPYGTYQARSYSITIDGATGLPRPGTRHPITDVRDDAFDAYVAGSSQPIFANGHFWVGRVDSSGEPFMDGDVYLGRTRVLANAIHPRVSISGSDGLVIGVRDDFTLYGRWLHWRPMPRLPIAGESADPRPPASAAGCDVSPGAPAAPVSPVDARIAGVLALLALGAVWIRKISTSC